MAIVRSTAGERRFVVNHHKVFALNIIVIVDFLFLKHFGYSEEANPQGYFFGGRGRILNYVYKLM